eukprot:TRINITY_DN2737_c0_g1_i1.p1 TRINITY_DN2737_c0_g1~~TRINITY_DN2737_c0_g1_i1.p1  ORF type:complete len:1142 (-),score=234.17 TRINITY_DN2737_c0_g1_i1:1851-5132(-)
MHVLIVMCVNVGVDPPGVIRTDNCARLECWIDPRKFANGHRPTSEGIGKILQHQYEHWQPRARYKTKVDATKDDIKKLCIGLRRSAREERVLFHYNGHGVPKPTANGEIWVFNHDYTQYIPLSIFEFQPWLGTPCVLVLDTSNAGTIVQWYKDFAHQRFTENRHDNRAQYWSEDNFILLGACSVDETLPTSPDLPADLFTSCLTTPIKTALKWFLSRSLVTGVTPDMIDRIPGSHQDRSSPFGELNWIFTTITDTIAWDTCRKDLFHTLFRNDLLVAILLRNYLLAERIMRSRKCTPVSHPELIPTYNHTMWQSWDLVADHILSQVPQIIDDRDYQYKPSTFFAEQLAAFEVWLEFGNEKMGPPIQLPILLQVILSHQHRKSALELLGRFFDLGPWAVRQGLSVGIFRYVLMLLQSTDPDLPRLLVFIWAKIIALQPELRENLLKENSHRYFLRALANPDLPVTLRTQAAFVLTQICDDNREGKTLCINSRILTICEGLLKHEDDLFRRWIVLLLGKVWENYDEGRVHAIEKKIHESLCELLQDPVPQVRAVTIYALSGLIGGSGRSGRLAQIEINLGLTFCSVTADASILVRNELVIATDKFVKAYENEFKNVMKNIITESAPKLENAEDEEVFGYLWKNLVRLLCIDPFLPRPYFYEKIRIIATEELKNEGVIPETNEKSKVSKFSLFRSSKPVIEEVEDMVADDLYSDIYFLMSELFQQSIYKRTEKPDAFETSWRLKRIEHVIDEGIRKGTEEFNFEKMENEIAYFDLKGAKTVDSMVFHAYDNIIVSAHGHTIGVWNWETSSRISTFFNCNPPLRTTSLSLLNQHKISPTLATGADDGIVRIWNDIYANTPRLVTAWRAIDKDDDLVKLENRIPSVGLLMECNDNDPKMIVSGNIRVLKIWDLETELSVPVPSGSEACVTSMTSLGNGEICAGFGDGTIRLYDPRANNGVLDTFHTEGTSQIVNVCRLNNDTDFVSGSLDGQVSIFDIRTRSALTNFSVGTGLTCLDAHPIFPLIACGQYEQKVRIFNTNGEDIETSSSPIKYHDGFLGQRIGSVSSVKFHKYHSIVAVGAEDSIVSVHARLSFKKVS